ncbi:MAG: S8 family serine peptidase, partial [Nitrososphaerales archaeon]
SISVRVSSNIDVGGISPLFRETGPNTSIFEAEVAFTLYDESGANRLRVQSGDTITASYGGVIGTARILEEAPVIPTDITPPRVILTINAGADYTLSSTIIADITCSDGSGSGCATAVLAINDPVRNIHVFSNSDPSGEVFDLLEMQDSPGIFYVNFLLTPTSQTGTIGFQEGDRITAEITVTGDGTKTVYAAFRDVAGNTSDQASDSIVLDTIAPTISDVSPMTAEAGFPTTYFVTYSDNLAIGSCNFFADGVNQGSMTLSTRGGTSGNASVSYTFTTAGTHTVQVKCKDIANNEGVGRIASININPAVYVAPDDIPPAVTVTIKSGFTGTASSKLQVDITCSDGSGSGCAGLLLAIADPDSNQDPSRMETIRNVLVFSNSDPSGEVFDLLEMQDSPGIFYVNFLLTPTSQTGTIGFQEGDRITAEITVTGVATKTVIVAAIDAAGNTSDQVTESTVIGITEPPPVIPSQVDPVYDPEVEFVKEAPLKREFVLGEVLIGLKTDVDPDSGKVRLIVARVGGEIIEIIKEINLVRISIPSGMEQEIIKQLKEEELVRFAGNNRYLVPTSLAEISDPDYSKQRSHYDMIGIPNSWRLGMGGTNVLVAVLDSGIDIDHPDLGANIWINDDSCDDRRDNDSNGFVDDCYGWNFSHSSNNIWDEGGRWPQCNGHGTHVAGIIGAVSNLEGGLGVAPDVTLMPLKVSANELIEGETVCVATEAIVAKAVIYAADNGAKVVNASFGCPNGEKCEMPAIGDAFEYASNKGLLIVVAAGNEAGIDDWQDYTQYVIEVSSVDISGELASYSNFGSGIEISAPGTTVYSTKFDDRYGIKTGTSQAAPLVSGCAALLLSSAPDLSNSRVEDALRNSAMDIGDNGRDNLYGDGLLDCNKALSSVGMQSPQLEAPADLSDISLAMKHKKKVSLIAVKNNGDKEVFGVQMKIDDGKIRFVKVRGWDRDRIDQSTVFVQTNDRAIKPGKSLIMLLIVDNKDSSYEWRAFDQGGLMAFGDVSPRGV